MKYTTYAIQQAAAAADARPCDGRGHGSTWNASVEMAVGSLEFVRHLHQAPGPTPRRPTDVTHTSEALSEAVGIARSRRPFAFRHVDPARAGTREHHVRTDQHRHPSSYGTDRPRPDRDRASRRSRCAPRRRAAPTATARSRTCSSPTTRSTIGQGEGHLLEVPADRELPRRRARAGRAVGSVGRRARRERARRREQATTWPSTEAPSTAARRRRGADPAAPGRLARSARRLSTDRSRVTFVEPGLHGAEPRRAPAATIPPDGGRRGGQ